MLERKRLVAAGWLAMAVVVGLGGCAADALHGPCDNETSADADDDGRFAPGSCEPPSDDCDDTNAAVFPGAAERCDGLDNNCDGLVDEGYPSLGKLCPTAGGQCGRNRCGADGGGVDCVAVAETPSPEVCDGDDNDCDGTIDEGFAVGEACSVGVGACKRSGVAVCNGTGDGVGCGVAAGAPGIEDCNGLDDDCNGAVDDVVGLCTDCQGDAVAPRACVGGVWALCPTALEICDGIDNDCDNAVDEDCTVPERRLRQFVSGLRSEENNETDGVNTFSCFGLYVEAELSELTAYMAAHPEKVGVLNPATGVPRMWGDLGCSVSSPADAANYDLHLCPLSAANGFWSGAPDPYLAWRAPMATHIFPMCNKEVFALELCMYGVIGGAGGGHASCNPAAPLPSIMFGNPKRDPFWIYASEEQIGTVCGNFESRDAALSGVRHDALWNTDVGCTPRVDSEVVMFSCAPDPETGRPSPWSIGITDTHTGLHFGIGMSGVRVSFEAGAEVEIAGQGFLTNQALPPKTKLYPYDSDDNLSCYAPVAAGGGWVAPMAVHKYSSPGPKSIRTVGRSSYTGCDVSAPADVTLVEFTLPAVDDPSLCPVEVFKTTAGP
ncbi:MAG: putative metal-binding motif-containing protein [Deltaproteobacteria bacterium]|nr:putative metal-binding motif-containing protein [Deltaproteobacteria bacterium]